MSLYKLPNGTKIREGNPFTFDDIQYPANWLNLATAEDLLDRGITIVMEAVRPDERFYNIVENEDGTLTITPRLLAGKKAEMIEAMRLSARTILAVTDWKIVRRAENGTPVDVETLVYRDAVRSAFGKSEAEINACLDIPALSALSFNWPQSNAL